MSLSNPTMLRTHSLSNADGQYDPYTDTRFRRLGAQAIGMLPIFLPTSVGHLHPCGYKMLMLH